MGCGGRVTGPARARSPFPEGRAVSPFSRSRGLTLLELSLAVGLLGLLFSMLLGFGLHARAAADLVRTRSELAEYSQALHRWYLLFQSYPCGEAESGQLLGETAAGLRKNLKKLVDGKVFARIELPRGGSSNVYFRSFLTRELPVQDPWGTPYIYLCDPAGKSYTLFSCGPDRGSEVLGDPVSTSTDDIFFER